jgi:hypothetical protein
VCLIQMKLFVQILSILLIRHYRIEAQNEISLTSSNLAAYNPLLTPGNGVFQFDIDSYPTDDKVCIRVSHFIRAVMQKI